jgi:hypothetical protein
VANFLLALDLLIAAAALASAWLWWAASRHRVRRISRDEVLDAADINRIVTALNRTQILSARAALATALVAVLGTLRVCLRALAG